MRDARIVKTDQALRGALLALLERKPLEQISIRDIAAEAEVHYATFFRHHATKEALLDHVASLTLFERIPLDQLLAQIVTAEIQSTDENQLFLFE